MYSYTYDANSGGIILNSTPTIFSKEPRPVYAAELDIFGFDKYWNYDKQNNIPYMWAEANTYWYRGVCVAKLKGGNIYNAPEIIIPLDEDGKAIVPEPKGKRLKPINIDLMVEKNKDFIEILEQTTVKKIVATFEKHMKKVDLFHVAYSGGKDSAVLLDLVKKALPKGSFVVIFGDTGMEFPDTYDNIEITRKMCSQEDIPFYTAQSHMKPEDSWKMFGPPSRVLRWCCSVHKSTPQTLKLREITGKNDYTGMAFVGVRAYESATRANYEYENFGKKQKGQYSYNSILEWTSAEVWLYQFANKITINKAYIKGNARAGCLLCPMSAGISDYIRRQCYPKLIENYIINIGMSCKKQYDEYEKYIASGSWSARKNGRDLLNNGSKYFEFNEKNFLRIEILKPNSDWMEWIKTIGSLEITNNDYFLLYKDQRIHFNIIKSEYGFSVYFSNDYIKINPKLGKLVKQVFRKSAYCQQCGACDAICKNDCIQFLNEKVKITNCLKCSSCHSIESGCYLFHSIRHPQGGGKAMKSLNSFAGHAPKIDWLYSFFELKDEFFHHHTLGPMMYDMFRRFLKDASLNEKNSFTPFAAMLNDLGWKTDVSQGLILVNLADENPQIKWYIDNLEIGQAYSRKYLIDLLTAEGLSDKAAKFLLSDFKRLSVIPLGTTLHFGHVTDNGELVRTKCSVSDPRVVLYSLFKFAEKCNDYKEFTLSTLMNDEIERDGISPSKIFGLERDELLSMLTGLSAKYPDFINATFTHDLEKITLAKDKSSAEVLKLFMEGHDNG